MSDYTLYFGRDDGLVPREDLAGFLRRLTSAWGQNVVGAGEERRAFRTRLRGDFAAGFDAMNMLHHYAFEAADWAAGRVAETINPEDKEDRELEQYYLAIRGITARALLTFDEVSWLLEGGYPKGAWTRVRTLQELAVAGLALASHGAPGGDHPDLVERYLNHHRAFARAEAEEIIATGALGSESVMLNADVLTSLESTRIALAEKYGKPYLRPWGWAAPLLDANKPPSYHQLAQKVLPDLQFFYGLASSHSHAGSKGWHENIVAREHETVLASGPTNIGIALPAVFATHFLENSLEVAVPTAIEGPAGRDSTGAAFLEAIADVAARAREAFEGAENAIEAREVGFQASLRVQSNMTPDSTTP